MNNDENNREQYRDLENIYKKHFETFLSEQIDLTKFNKKSLVILSLFLTFAFEVNN